MAPPTVSGWRLASDPVHVEVRDDSAPLGAHDDRPGLHPMVALVRCGTAERSDPAAKLLNRSGALSQPTRSGSEVLDAVEDGQDGP
jgi:hypothetical protein